MKYWEIRRTIFGDNAFLPLRLEDGALTPEDVEHIETGAFCLLPVDEHGRCIIYHDRSRFDRLNHLSHISIVSFYSSGSTYICGEDIVSICFKHASVAKFCHIEVFVCSFSSPQQIRHFFFLHWMNTSIHFVAASGVVYPSCRVREG